MVLSHAFGTLATLSDSITLPRRHSKAKMMIMRGASSLFVLATLVKEASAACSVDTHHPENGGYYVAGINGLDNSDRQAAVGATTTWAKDIYYKHGEMKACEGIFCPPNAGAAARLRPHLRAPSLLVCGRLGSTVYEMPDQKALDECDFTQASSRAPQTSGSPTVQDRARP